MEQDPIIEANILFLSDDQKISTYIKDLLEGEGYIVNGYSDTNSFMVASENCDFDLIILDMGSRKINGIELCKRIRDNFMLKNIPIILLVNKEQTMERIKGIYAGGDDYIEKSPQAPELLTRIKANIWRAKRDLDANPLTKLPGNASILKELDRIKQDPVSNSELKRAKDFYLGQLAISLEDTLEHMLWIGESAISLDRIFKLGEVTEQINQIETKDLRVLAENVFDPNDRNLAVIGPLKEKQEELYGCLRRN